MEDEEIRKVDIWTGRHKLVEVAFQPVTTAGGSLDPFFNTNRPEDLERAAGYLA
jgi:molybdopterin-guanine dinucleotide biosynthesis protein A